MSWLRKALTNELLPDKLKLLPRGYERVGHVAVLSLPEELEEWRGVIAQKLLEVGGVRTVAVRRGPVEGWSRSPNLEVVAGEPRTETLHKENGCFFKLDVARTMFSKGNMHERQRIPKLVQEGEVVVDLFAGVGQFSIPIAKHANPARVYAVEKNPIAFSYLCENIRINKLGSVIVPLRGDCLEISPRRIADRVLMGILHTGYRYLPLALEVLKPAGGVIHYHETSPCKNGFERARRRILEIAKGWDVKFLESRVVKRYSPGINHVVIDVLVTPTKGVLGEPVR